MHNVRKCFGFFIFFSSESAASSRIEATTVPSPAVYKMYRPSIIMPLVCQQRSSKRLKKFQGFNKKAVPPFVSFFLSIKADHLIAIIRVFDRSYAKLALLLCLQMQFPFLFFKGIVNIYRVDLSKRKGYCKKRYHHTWRRCYDREIMMPEGGRWRQIEPEG